MATDGDIDFSNYTHEQLDAAVGRMDRYRYPINYRNLILEYQRRRLEETKAAVSAAAAADVAAAPNIESNSVLELKTSVLEFKTTFEPNAGPSTWLGPSRNDFHLVGSGTLRIDREHVRVTGRRFGVVLGLPLKREVEIERQAIVNAETDGNVIRFEHRLPGSKVRGLTMWLPSPSEAERLAKALPTERTIDFRPQLVAHVEFERCLIAQSPNTPATYGLVGINVLVFLATAIVAHDWLKFDGRFLIALGSNFGPYTADGDWWRLLTSMFLHQGLIHLAFNMWALASFGPMVERLYGSVSYLAAYLVAGLSGSLASITWRPDINSIGASAAIFGILGALIAAQMRNGASIPNSVLRPLRNSSLIFTCCALAAGLISTGVDNAAHIGGLTAGFLVGLALSRQVTGQRVRANQFIRRCVQVVPLIALLLGAGVWSARNASTRLTGEGLFAKMVHWYVPGEAAALERSHELSRLAKAGKWDDDTYASGLDGEIVPFWKDADARLARVDLEPTSPSYSNLQFLRTVTNGRLRAYQLSVRGLRRHDANTAAAAKRDQERIDELINDRIAGNEQ